MTIQIPGERKKQRGFATIEDMTRGLAAMKLPTGTKLFVMCTPMNLGYGLEVREDGDIW